MQRINTASERIVLNESTIRRLATYTSAVLHTSVALKEWASVVLALERGLQDVILRRGGIAEPNDTFRPEHDQFLLFPTYFHQQAAGLAIERRRLYDEALSQEPRAGTLRITSGVRVRRAWPVRDLSELRALDGRHVYNEETLVARLQSPYGHALYAMHVDVVRLEPALELPLLGEYGGCRSWVELRRD